MKRKTSFTSLPSAVTIERPQRYALSHLGAISVAYVTAEAPPTLLVHGTDDAAASCENSERLAAALEQAGADVTYLPVEGTEHSFVLRFGTPEVDMALAAIEAFLAEAFETAH